MSSGPLRAFAHAGCPRCGASLSRGTRPVTTISRVVTRQWTGSGSRGWRSSRRASGGKTGGAITTSYCAPARLRQHHDTVRYCGTLVSWLLRERLLDELHLRVFPVVLGAASSCSPSPATRCRRRSRHRSTGAAQSGRWSRWWQSATCAGRHLPPIALRSSASTARSCSRRMTNRPKPAATSAWKSSPKPTLSRPSRGSSRGRPIYPGHGRGQLFER